MSHDHLWFFNLICRPKDLLALSLKLADSGKLQRNCPIHACG